jgi:hypothetical protein
MPRATVGPMHVRFAMRWHLAVRVPLHFDGEAADLSRENSTGTPTSSSTRILLSGPGRHDLPGHCHEFDSGSLPAPMPVTVAAGGTGGPQIYSACNQAPAGGLVAGRGAAPES